MALNTWPTKLSGVQLANPIFPPGRQTRTSSLAAFCWFGVNITPKVESTTSKLASPKGRSSASASWKVTGRRSAAARSRPRSSSVADIVGRHHLGEAPRSGKRRVAVAGCDIEDALVAAEIDGLAQRLADDL